VTLRISMATLYFHCETEDLNLANAGAISFFLASPNPVAPPGASFSPGGAAQVRMGTISDEYRPLDSLKQHPRNYNVHDEAQAESMANRIRHHGFTAPLIVTPDAGCFAACSRGCS